MPNSTLNRNNNNNIVFICWWLHWLKYKFVLVIFRCAVTFYQNILALYTAHFKDILKHWMKLLLIMSCIFSMRINFPGLTFTQWKVFCFCKKSASETLNLGFIDKFFEKSSSTYLLWKYFLAFDKQSSINSKQFVVLKNWFS